MYLHTRSRDRLDERRWPMLVRQVETALKRWRDPDQGLWEVRGPGRHFTASKVLCWVAADRGAKLAGLRGDQQRAAEWRKAADEIHADVCAHGTDERGVFCQHYDTTALDASRTRIPGGNSGTSRRPSPTWPSSMRSCTSSGKTSRPALPRPGLSSTQPAGQRAGMSEPARVSVADH